MSQINPLAYAKLQNSKLVGDRVSSTASAVSRVLSSVGTTDVSVLNKNASAIADVTAPERAKINLIVEAFRMPLNGIPGLGIFFRLER